MAMPERRIVVATDFRTLSDEGVRLGMELGAALKAKIALVHAADLSEIDRTVSVPSGMQVIVDALEERLRARRKRLQTKLDEQIAACGKIKDAVSQSILVDERPWHAIVEAAGAPGTELIILGTRGKHRSALERVLGTTTERVVRHAPRPVLVLQPDGFLPTLVGAHWVVGIDFSDASIEAATYAAKLARETAGTFSLIHVVPLGQERLELEVDEHLEKHWVQAAEAQLAALAQRLGHVAHSQVVRETRQMSAGEALCHACEQIDGTVLVVSAGNHGTVSRMMLGSTADRCLRFASTAVLIVRHPQ